MTDNIKEENIQESCQENENIENKKEDKKTMGKEILSWVLTLTLAIVVGLLVRNFGVEPVRISGPSMDNTLHDGQLTILNRFSYVIGDPQRGDIINCHSVYYNERIVKRVIGIPGDTVEIIGGDIYVNGVEIDDSYAIHANDSLGPITVPEGQYFVVGDNRPMSGDSRLPYVGMIDRDLIYGKLLGIIYPFEDIQFTGLNIPH